MSFRARTRTITPIVPRRRSLSSSRTTPTTTSSIYSNTTTSPYTSRTNGYNSYTSPSYSQSSNYGSSYGGSRDNIYSRNGGYSSNYGSGAKTNGYGSGSGYSDRYVSPYTSSYDNGVVTASLNLSSKSPYSNSSALNRSRNSNLLSASGITGSTPTLNSYGNTALIAANIGRSSSFREQERKGRSRNRKASAAAAARSMSCSSEKSEGYESGSESTVSRSRLGSSNSINSEKKKDETENGEILDYKALWEASQIENDKLKVQLKKRDEDLFSSKSALDRFTNATTKNSLSEIEKRERRAMERKLSEMEEELKQLDALKTENQRLKDENGALIRVISKLSK